MPLSSKLPLCNFTSGHALRGRKHPISVVHAEDRAPALRISKGPGAARVPFIFTALSSPCSVGVWLKPGRLADQAVDTADQALPVPETRRCSGAPRDFGAAKLATRCHGTHGAPHSFKSILVGFHQSCPGLKFGIL